MPVVPCGCVCEASRAPCLGNEWGAGVWGRVLLTLTPESLGPLPASPAPLVHPGGTLGRQRRGQPRGQRQEAPPGGEGGGIPAGRGEDPRHSQGDRGAGPEGENEGANPTVVHRVPVSEPQA